MSTALAVCAEMAQYRSALRAAAEDEVIAIQALSPEPLTAFEKECIRTAFKAGADFGSRKQKERNNAS